MKITEYPKTKELSEGDVFLIGGPNSTKTMEGMDLFTVLEEISTEEPWVAHRNHFRGKNLGSEFTAEQKAAIRDGSFKDLWVGDYWHIGDYNYRIADINYWLVNTDLSKVLNHLAIVPDTVMGTSKWSNGQSDTAHNNYYNSLIRGVVRSTVRDTIISAFGEENLIQHMVSIVNAADNGNASSHIEMLSDVELMSEGMVFGSSYNGVFSTNTINSSDYLTEGHTQFSLFNLNRRYIDIYSADKNSQYGDSFYLRESSYTSKGGASYINGVATASGYGHNALGIRPAFAIG